MISKKIQSFLFFLIFLLIAILVGNFLIFEIQRFEKEISLAQILTNFPKKKQKPITLIFVGDLMLDRGVEYMIEKYGEGDYRFPFLKIAGFLQGPDILFGNLEGPISDEGVKVGSIYSFRHDPKAIDGLAFAGFNIISVANNHIFDYGREAMEDTFKRLKEAKIDYVGGGFNENEAQSPIIKEIEDTKIAFLAYTNLGSEYWAAQGEKSGIAWLNEANLKKDITLAKNQADLIMVSMHFGEEYQTSPTKEQEYFAHLAIDSGADLIIGHHPHVIQPIEKYQNGWIAYSLGNFVFDQGFSEQTMRGILLKVLIENNEIKKLIPIDIKINKYFQPER